MEISEFMPFGNAELSKGELSNVITYNKELLEELVEMKENVNRESKMPHRDRVVNRILEIRNVDRN